MRVAGFVYSPLFPAPLGGSTYAPLFHVTDWLPTLATATGSSLGSRKHLPLDGKDQWACLLGGGGAPSGGHARIGRGGIESASEPRLASQALCAPRDEVVMNINIVCDVPGDHGAPDVGGDFTTE